MLQIRNLGMAGVTAGALIVGALAAAVTGVLAIRTLVALLAREAFHFFAPYCWAVGAGYLLYLGFRG